MNCFSTTESLSPNPAYAGEESSSRNSATRDYVRDLRRQMIDEVLPILRKHGTVERFKLADMIGERPCVLDDMAKYGTRYIIRDRLHVGYTDVNARCKDMVTVFRIHPDLQ